MSYLTAWLVLFSAIAASAQVNGHQIKDVAVQWVEYYAANYDTPLDLVEAIIDVESGWNPYAVSTKGAAGIMQLMPTTALRFGVKDRFRLDENIRGGVAYLAILQKEFHGDPRLITAAYYVGERPIAWQGLAYSSLDVQTYVKRVAARYRLRRLLRRTRVPSLR
jgi:soluble lytic murein transglycosylase-like protein